MKLYNTTKIVKFLLEKYPELRDNDYLLWLAVIERTTTDDVALNITVGEFLKIAKYMKIPPYISVARARRKLQEQYPELRATAETRAARAEQEKQYEEYARTNV